MNKDSSKLFNRSGYISLREYVKDIETMRKTGPWKIPFGFMDRFQFLFLSVVVNFSWFSDILYIFHTSNLSPSYKILFSYLQKKIPFDSLTEGSLHTRGYFSYHLQKKITTDHNTWVISGQGVAEDRATALSKAFGEMIERTVAGMYDMNKNILVESPVELVKESSMVYPPKYHRFLDVQKKRHKELNYDQNKKIVWVKGKNLITQEITYVPKQLTSWFSENYQAKNFFIHPTTNGAAGYFTKDGAVLRGLLEAVQRDAFFVHWLTMTPPQIILQDTLPQKIQDKIKDFELFGISLCLVNVTAIPIPSVFIVAINNQSKIPQVVLSGAASLIFEDAINDALREMVMASEMFYYHNTEIESKYEKNEPEPFVSGIGKIGRQLYWRGEKRVKQFDWFLSGDKISYHEVCKQNLISKEDDSSRLRKCFEVLGKLSSDYFPVVYFPENRIQEELGFYIAQVYIPKAFPLYLTEYYGTFDSDRLKEFALSKNIKNWELNPFPHMFS